MDAKPTHPLDTELSDLWFRRPDLSDAEWGRLYEIVTSVLIGYRPRELASLSGERADYVHDFYVDKVFRFDAKPSTVHVGALRSIHYVRYLRDQLDKAGTQKKYFNHAEDPDDESLEMDHATAKALDMPDGDQGPDSGFQEFAEIGWPAARLCESARGWLRVQEPWVPIYLAFSFCADAEKSEALVHLARRHGISNYASKASRLGINWSPRKGGGQGMPMEKTLIGQWVKNDLDLTTAPEDSQKYLTALKILCLEALNWGDALEIAT